MYYLMSIKFILKCFKFLKHKKVEKQKVLQFLNLNSYTVAIT